MKMINSVKNNSKNRGSFEHFRILNVSIRLVTYYFDELFLGTKELLQVVIV